MGIFKACDIRGIADTELTDAVARRLARAIGCQLRGKRVVLGGDVRLSTPRLKELFAHMLAASGCTVLDLGTVATPVFYYALKHLGAADGVMVTASHNPAPYNGFKLILDGQPVTEAVIAKLQSLYEAEARVNAPGSREAVSVAASYLAAMTAKAPRGRLKIVLDAGGGAASRFAPALYRALGYEIVELFCEPDGRFLNRSPNPAIAENLKALCQKVVETKADLGIAFDGDGDRAAFVDETGRAVENDAVLALLARHFLAQEKGAVVYDAKCSMTVAEQIALAGGQPLMARAGHTFIRELFLRENAVFAGEVSGHFFFRALGYDDGMFAGTQVAALLKDGVTLAALINQVPVYVATPEYRIAYVSDDKEKLLDGVAGRLKQYSVNRIDGVRVEFSDGWGMIRASVTEPLLTLRFEAKTAVRLQEIQALLLSALPENVRRDVETEIQKNK